MKIGIITIIDNNNYGNRLQNYATQEIIKTFGFQCITIYNDSFSNDKEKLILIVFKNVLYTFKKIVLKLLFVFCKYSRIKKIKRKIEFYTFNQNIMFSSKKITAYSKKINKNFDYIICGSDQIWNPFFGRMKYVDLLLNFDSNKRISFSASFGVNQIPNSCISNIKKLKTFKCISVREDRGKEIICELTGRNDVEVLIDPTMLLTAEEWDKISKKPKMLKEKKYILNYFLGNLSEKRRKEIYRVASDNNCLVINILDKNDPFYICGPSEFLYLEKHAFLICTDSFHSSVFAILYNVPFLVFDRDDKEANMNSRIDTLLTTFKLEGRKFKGNISTYDLTCNYSMAYRILENERKKSKLFLKKALFIKDSDKQ